MAITIGPEGAIFGDNTRATSTGQGADSGDLISITTFTSTGTYTVPANCKSLLVKAVGGGGGSAGHLESGGAGGYVEKFIQGIAPGTNIAVTVGGGGGGVGYYAAAGAGGTSSFGSYCSATGGYGANNNYSHTGGHGGSGSGGDVNIWGGGGYGHGNTLGSWGAKGAASFWGGGFGTRHSGGETIGPGAPGAGASPGTSGGTAGKTASAGMVVVYAYT
jgi:hypothetical protein